jgi:hypothetical protein
MVLLSLQQPPWKAGLSGGENLAQAGVNGDASTSKSIGNTL